MSTHYLRKKALPACPQSYLDCFALTPKGSCLCLSDTTFTNSDGTRRKCPFYKSQDEFLKGFKKYGGLRPPEK